MPNRRAAERQKTNENQRPHGIIRVTALCDLCRYRHKTHNAVTRIMPHCAEDARLAA